MSVRARQPPPRLSEDPPATCRPSHAQTLTSATSFHTPTVRLARALSSQVLRGRTWRSSPRWSRSTATSPPTPGSIGGAKERCRSLRRGRARPPLGHRAAGSGNAIRDLVSARAALFESSWLLWLGVASWMPWAWWVRGAQRGGPWRERAGLERASERVWGRSACT